MSYVSETPQIHSGKNLIVPLSENRGSSQSATSFDNWYKQGLQETAHHETYKAVPPVDPGNPCLNELVDKIKALSKLEEDWDDEGAPKIDIKAILKSSNFYTNLLGSPEASKFTRSLMPAVFPLSDGGICFYWQYRGFQAIVTLTPTSQKYELTEKHTTNTIKRYLVDQADAARFVIRVMSQLSEM